MLNRATRVRSVVLAVVMLALVMGMAFTRSQVSVANAATVFSASGSVGNGGFVDYVVYLEVGIPYTITLDCPGGQFDPVLTVFLSGSPVASDDDGGPNTCATFYNSALVIYTPSVSANYTIRAADYIGTGDQSPTGGAFQLTVSSNATGCGLADGAYQVKLTANAVLYWSPDKPVQPELAIPAGKTVTVVSGDASWLKIIWSCQYLYIKNSGTSINYEKSSKPYFSGK